MQMYDRQSNLSCMIGLEYKGIGVQSGSISQVGMTSMIHNHRRVCGHWGPRTWEARIFHRKQIGILLVSVQYVGAYFCWFYIKLWNWDLTIAGAQTTSGPTGDMSMHSKQIFLNFAHASSTGPTAGDFECELGLQPTPTPVHPAHYWLIFMLCNFTELNRDIFSELFLSMNLCPYVIIFFTIADFLPDFFKICYTTLSKK